MTDTNTTQMVADLRSTDDSIQGMGWVAPGIGLPNSPLGFLNSGINPLSGLAAAGLSWFTPLVSFLGDGLTQLQGGDGSSVTSGSQDFGQAGQDVGGLADSYRQSVSTQTADWSGAAADDYRDAAAQHASGVEGLGQASTTTSSAIIGAGQVVAQAISEVLELIAEAVSQIVPIMTQAVARAGETNGESIAEAIPPCVAIAVEYALRIAAKLAALVASGDNLMKLVQGGMAVVDMIKQAMSTIGNQSVQPSLDPQTGAVSTQQQGGGSTTAADAAQGADAMAAWNSGGTGSSSAQPSSDGGFGGMSGGDVAATPDVSVDPVDTSTHLASVVPPALTPFHASVPDASAVPGHGGVPTGAVPRGGVLPVGGPDRSLAAGARVGAGRGTGATREEGEQRTAGSTKSGGSTQGSAPAGAMGARPGNEKDKEHHRKYDVQERYEEDFQVAPSVLTGGELDD